MNSRSSRGKKAAVPLKDFHRTFPEAAQLKLPTESSQHREEREAARAVPIQLNVGGVQHHGSAGQSLSGGSGGGHPSALGGQFHGGQASGADGGGASMGGTAFVSGGSSSLRAVTAGNSVMQNVAAHAAVAAVSPGAVGPLASALGVGGEIGLVGGARGKGGSTGATKGLMTRPWSAVVEGKLSGTGADNSSTISKSMPLPQTAAETLQVSAGDRHNGIMAPPLSSMQSSTTANLNNNQIVGGAAGGSKIGSLQHGPEHTMSHLRPPKDRGTALEGYYGRRVEGVIYERSSEGRSVWEDEESGDGRPVRRRLRSAGADERSRWEQRPQTDYVASDHTCATDASRSSSTAAVGSQAKGVGSRHTPTSPPSVSGSSRRNSSYGRRLDALSVDRRAAAPGSDTEPISGDGVRDRDKEGTDAQQYGGGYFEEQRQTKSKLRVSGIEKCSPGDYATGARRDAGVRNTPSKQHDPIPRDGHEAGGVIETSNSVGVHKLAGAGDGGIRSHGTPPYINPSMSYDSLTGSQQSLQQQKHNSRWNEQQQGTAPSASGTSQLPQQHTAKRVTSQSYRHSDNVLSIDHEPQKQQQQQRSYCDRQQNQLERQQDVKPVAPRGAGAVKGGSSGGGVTSSRALDSSTDRWSDSIPYRCGSNDHQLHPDGGGFRPTTAVPVESYQPLTLPNQSVAAATVAGSRLGLGGARVGHGDQQTEDMTAAATTNSRDKADQIASRGVKDTHNFYPTPGRERGAAENFSSGLSEHVHSDYRNEGDGKRAIVFSRSGRVDLRGAGVASVVPHLDNSSNGGGSGIKRASETSGDAAYGRFRILSHSRSPYNSEKTNDHEASHQEASRESDYATRFTGRRQQHADGNTQSSSRFLPPHSNSESTQLCMDSRRNTATAGSIDQCSNYQPHYSSSSQCYDANSNLNEQLNRRAMPLDVVPVKQQTASVTAANMYFVQSDKRHPQSFDYGEVDAAPAALVSSSSNGGNTDGHIPVNIRQPSRRQIAPEDSLADSAEISGLSQVSHLLQQQTHLHHHHQQLHSYYPTAAPMAEGLFTDAHQRYFLAAHTAGARAGTGTTSSASTRPTSTCVSAVGHPSLSPLAALAANSMPQQLQYITPSCSPAPQPYGASASQLPYVGVGVIDPQQQSTRPPQHRLNSQEQQQQQQQRRHLVAMGGRVTSREIREAEVQISNRENAGVATQQQQPPSQQGGHYYAQQSGGAEFANPQQIHQTRRQSITTEQGQQGMGLSALSAFGCEMLRGDYVESGVSYGGSEMYHRREVQQPQQQLQLSPQHQAQQFNHHQQGAQPQWWDHEEQRMHKQQQHSVQSAQDSQQWQQQQQQQPLTAPPQQQGGQRATQQQYNSHQHPHTMAPRLSQQRQQQTAVSLPRDSSKVLNSQALIKDGERLSQQHHSQQQQHRASPRRSAFAVDAPQLQQIASQQRSQRPLSPPVRQQSGAAVTKQSSASLQAQQRIPQQTARISSDSRSALTSNATSLQFKSSPEQVAHRSSEAVGSLNLVERTNGLPAESLGNHSLGQSHPIRPQQQAPSVLRGQGRGDAYSSAANGIVNNTNLSYKSEASEGVAGVRLSFTGDHKCQDAPVSSPSRGKVASTRAAVAGGHQGSDPAVSGVKQSIRASFNKFADQSYDNIGLRYRDRFHEHSPAVRQSYARSDVLGDSAKSTQEKHQQQQRNVTNPTTLAPIEGGPEPKRSLVQRQQAATPSGGVVRSPRVHSGIGSVPNRNSTGNKNSSNNVTGARFAPTQPGPRNNLAVGGNVSSAAAAAAVRDPAKARMVDMAERVAGGPVGPAMKSMVESFVHIRSSRANSLDKNLNPLDTGSGPVSQRTKSPENRLSPKRTPFSEAFGRSARQAAPCRHFQKNRCTFPDCKFSHDLPIPSAEVPNSRPAGAYASTSKSLGNSSRQQQVVTNHNSSAQAVRIHQDQQHRRRRWSPDRRGQAAPEFEVKGGKDGRPQPKMAQYGNNSKRGPPYVKQQQQLHSFRKAPAGTATPNVNAQKQQQQQPQPQQHLQGNETDDHSKVSRKTCHLPASSNSTQPVGRGGVSKVSKVDGELSAELSSAVSPAPASSKAIDGTTVSLPPGSAKGATMQTASESWGSKPFEAVTSLQAGGKSSSGPSASRSPQSLEVGAESGQTSSLDPKASFSNLNGDVGSKGGSLQTAQAVARGGAGRSMGTSIEKQMASGDALQQFDNGQGRHSRGQQTGRHVAERHEASMRGGFQQRNLGGERQMKRSNQQAGRSVAEENAGADITGMRNRSQRKEAASASKAPTTSSLAAEGVTAVVRDPQVTLQGPSLQKGSDAGRDNVQKSTHTDNDESAQKSQQLEKMCTAASEATGDTIRKGESPDQVQPSYSKYSSTTGALYTGVAARRGGGGRGRGLKDRRGGGFNYSRVSKVGLSGDSTNEAMLDGTVGEVRPLLTEDETERQSGHVKIPGAADLNAGHQRSHINGPRTTSGISPAAAAKNAPGIRASKGGNPSYRMYSQQQSHYYYKDNNNNSGAVSKASNATKPYSQRGSRGSDAQQRSYGGRGRESNARGQDGTSSGNNHRFLDAHQQQKASAKETTVSIAPLQSAESSHQPKLSSSDADQQRGTQLLQAQTNCSASLPSTAYPAPNPVTSVAVVDSSQPTVVTSSTQPSDGGGVVGVLVGSTENNKSAEEVLAQHSEAALRPKKPKNRGKKKRGKVQGANSDGNTDSAAASVANGLASQRPGYVAGGNIWKKVDRTSQANRQTVHQETISKSDGSGVASGASKHVAADEKGVAASTTRSGAGPTLIVSQVDYTSSKPEDSNGQLLKSQQQHQKRKDIVEVIERQPPKGAATAATPSTTIGNHGGAKESEQATGKRKEVNSNRNNRRTAKATLPKQRTGESGDGPSSQQGSANIDGAARKSALDGESQNGQGRIASQAIRSAVK